VLLFGLLHDAARRMDDPAKNDAYEARRGRTYSHCFAAELARLKGQP